LSFSLNLSLFLYIKEEEGGGRESEGRFIQGRREKGGKGRREGE